MKLHQRVWTRLTLASGIIALAALIEAPNLNGDMSLMSPATHQLGTYVTRVGWIAGGLFALCMLIGAGTLAFGLRRSHF